MKWRRALVAGIAGGLALSAFCGLTRLIFSLPLHLEAIYGALAGMPPGSVEAFWVGLGLHLGLSALVGLFYGLTFDLIRSPGGWDAGGTLAIFHLFGLGAALALVPDLGPTLPEPGAMLMKLGAWVTIAFLLAHVLFGVVLGAVYVAPHRPRPRARRGARPQKPSPGSATMVGSR